MALLVKDRIKETTTTTGTGTITLAGAVTGYQAFSVIGNASTTYYAIEDANGTGWEVGIGTYTLSGTTLARTTILASSNSGSAITLTSGTHDVFVTYPAGKAGFNDQGIAKTFTASGTVTAGKPVILEAAGDAAQIAETTTTNADPTVGSVTSMDGTATTNTRCKTTYDSTTGSFYMPYKDVNNSSYPTVVAGSMSSGTMTWGTPVVIQTSAMTHGPSITTGNGRVWVSWTISSSSDTWLSSATISGTTISAFETPTDISLASTENKKMVYDTDADYIVLLYGLSAKTYVKPFYVESDGSITIGASVEVAASDDGNYKSDMIYDPDTNRTIIAYQDPHPYPGVCQVIQATGTTGSPTLTAGSDVAIDGSDAIQGVSLSYDTTNNKVFLIYNNTTDGLTKGVIGTVTGGGTNSISFAGDGTVVDYTAGIPYFDSVYDADGEKVMLFIKQPHSSEDLYYRVITVSASSFSVSTPVLISEDTMWIESDVASFGSGKGVLMGLQPPSQEISYVTSYFGTTTTSNVTATNYLGVAATTASDTNPVEVNIPGSINNNQSGLTIGSQYFSTNAAVVGTTGPTFLGTAVSATALQLEKKSTPTLYGTSDGAITAGKPVIVEADGDFAEIVATSGLGTTTEDVDTSFTYWHNGTSDNDGTFVLAYRGASNYGNALVVTISGTTLTIGTPTVFESSTSNYETISYDTVADKYLICWQDHSDTSLWGIVGTVSGTTISFGTKSEGDSDCAYKNVSSAWDEDAEKHWVIYHNASQIDAIIATVSGTSISWGTSQSIASGLGANPDEANIVYNTNSNVAIIAWTMSDSDNIFVIGGTVSGTTMTFGSSVSFTGDTELSNNVPNAMCYNNDGPNVLINYTKNASSGSDYDIYTRYITNSGTTLTVAAESSAITEGRHNRLISTSAGNCLMIYKDYNSPYDVNIRTGAIGASSVTWSDAIPIEEAGNSDRDVAVYNSGGNNCLLGWLGDGDDLALRAYLVSGTNLTAENYIGIAKATVADATAVEVTTVGGADNQQSSLTPGQLYYVQEDGTLALTPDTTSVIAGTALSATKLLVSRS